MIINLEFWNCEKKKKKVISQQESCWFLLLLNEKLKEAQVTES